MTTAPLSVPLGVVLVAYNSADVILDCLETLMAAAMMDGTDLRVVVVDNASPDDSVAAIRAWAAGGVPYAPPADLPFAHIPLPKPLPEGRLTILSAGVNGGFAAGVNIGLRHLFADSAIQRVWILNPDSVVPPGTPAAFARHDPGPFALMGGRVLYYDKPDMIQIDGGTLDRRTGVTGNINLGGSRQDSAAPSGADLAFVTGASMVASRAFWEHAGPMPEDYFLYYEEVDWALRRGTLPLAVAPGAIVHHRAGTAIGSPTLGRPASPFSLYFKHRARLRFVRRHLPASLSVAWAYTLAKAGQYRLKGWREEARAVMAGARNAPPPQAVRDRLPPAAAALAFPDHQARPASASALSVASASRNRP
jgi:GT2 family glycosyltransferase